MAYVDFTRMNELIIPAQNDDALALDELLRLGYVFVRVKQRKAGWWLPGAEHEDLVQEGMIGFVQALRSWEPGGPTFSKFAALCINREFAQAVRRHDRKKQRFLTRAISLDAPLTRSESPHSNRAYLSDFKLADPNGLGADPASLVATSDDTAHLMSAFGVQLSALEYSALDQVLVEGRKYQDVASELGVKAKAVDNAVTRIRRKIVKRAAQMAEDRRLSNETRALLQEVAAGTRKVSA